MPPPFWGNKNPNGLGIGTPKVKTLGGASCGVCILCLAPVPWSMVGFVDGWCVFFCGGNSQFHVIVVLSLIFVDSFVILNMCISISECIDSSKIDWCISIYICIL